MTKHWHYATVPLHIITSLPFAWRTAMTSTRIFLLCALISSSLVSLTAQTEKTLIIGGSRGIGWQLAQTISSKPDNSCTILVRDKEKAEKRCIMHPQANNCTR